MKTAKKSTRKVSSSKKTATAKKVNTLRGFKKHHALALPILVLAIGLTVGLLLPESAKFSYENILGKNRGAPYMDTLSGNYSVSGEAASYSLLVKYRSEVPDAARGKVNEQVGAKTKRRIDRLGVDIVQVASTKSVGEIMSSYKARGEVEYVEPNFLAKRFLTPNDSLYAKQWYLQKIEAPKAWDVSQGGFGPIAIIDTGITASQSDLNGSVLSGYNFVNDTANTNDDNGHGTHVAGIVSAATNNSIGIASIGFKGSLLPVKVLDDTGAGTYGDVASGIIFAADQGAKIINLSLGGSSSSRTMQEAIKYAQARGVIVVAAAGNNSNDSPVYPAAYPGVIAVTATNQEDTLAPFSSYGDHVYISAPGVSIVSTYNSGGYVTLSGTSMAAPAVSGLIGLALSRGSTAASTVLDDLKATSDKIGAYAYDQNGWNRYYGYGRINAAKLIAAHNPAVVAAPEPTAVTSPVSGASGRQNATRSANNGLQFNVNIEGSVDSVDSSRSVIVVKVKSSSNALELSSNNLIDLYVNAETSIVSGGSSLTISSVKAGDTLNIKALWKDNQLTARNVTVQGGHNSQENNQPSQAGNRSRKP
jgi:thermitase